MQLSYTCLKPNAFDKIRNLRTEYKLQIRFCNVVGQYVEGYKTAKFIELFERELLTLKNHICRLFTVDLPDYPLLSSFRLASVEASAHRVSEYSITRSRFSTPYSAVTFHSLRHPYNGFDISLCY